MTALPTEVAEFVAAASSLPLGALAEIRTKVMIATASGDRDAAKAPKLGAADFSALQKHVKDAFAPRAGELRAVEPGGSLRAAVSNTTVAAQAIWRREQLDRSEYDAYVGMFAEAGVAVPPLPA